MTETIRRCTIARSMARSTLLVLLSTLAAACSSGSGGDTPPPTPSPTPTIHVRLLAGNLTSGTQQSWLAPGIRILAGTHADVAMLQELNVGGNTAPEISGFVTSAFGAGFSIAREADAGAQLPNAIVSRWPIVDSGTWTDAQVGNRGFEWARIDLPGSTDLYAVSVHLLTTGASERDAEAHELVTDLQGLVPAGAYVVLAGDFNTDSRTEACIATLSSIFTTSGPYPADQSGNDDTNQPRSAPHDWVLVNPILQSYAVPLTIGTNAFPAGLVADTRVYDPIADLAPAQTGDSGVSGMQHMAVVRELFVP